MITIFGLEKVIVKTLYKEVCRKGLTETSEIMRFVQNYDYKSLIISIHREICDRVFAGNLGFRPLECLDLEVNCRFSKDQRAVFLTPIFQGSLDSIPGGLFVVNALFWNLISDEEHKISKSLNSYNIIYPADLLSV